MKKKILMVYPKCPKTFWNYETLLPVLGKKAMFPPLGLLTIAALLPEEYEVKLIDMNAYILTIKDIDEADLVFISAMGIQQESFVEVVNLCLARNKTMVAGGPIIWSAYDLGILNIDKIDHLIIGEAETILPEFIKDYENGTARRVYTTADKPDLSISPRPRYDLINLNDYAMVPVQFSRGCPFQCEFCDIIEMNGRKVRTKTQEQFLGELEFIYQQGYKGEVFIVDDNFIGNISKTKMLLRKILGWQKANNYPFYFITQVSVNVAHDEELLDLMADAAFGMVFVGIETPDESTLINIHKQQNVRENLIDSVKKIQAKRIIVMGGFIIGFDTDTEKIFDMQINFLQEAGIPIAMVGLLGAMNNTQLYRRLQKENRIVGNGWHTYNNIDLYLNFKPLMSERVLIEGYKRVISEIYSPKKWFERCLKMLEHYPQDPPPRTVQMFKDDATLWHKVSSITRDLLFFFKQIFSFYGLEYIKFMIKASKVNKANALAGIAFAGTFPHYHEIARQIVNAKYHYIEDIESKKSEPEPSAQAV
jgi:radical SAM superfamily enzyme YgiQ (UPF0313 family)